jgi:hypothetical protein
MEGAILQGVGSLGATLYQLKLWRTKLQMTDSLRGHFIFFPKLASFCTWDQAHRARVHKIDVV